MLTPKSIFTIGFFIFIYSQFICADTFKEGGDAYIKGDYVTAGKKFLDIAKKGDHRAMYALGSMYAEGVGVEKDYKKAFKWFSSAAKYGRVDAQYKLGLMYDEGAGVAQNYRRAARLYNKTAKKGYAYAQFKLGLLYVKGHGVKQDNVNAYAWLVAAKQNLMKDQPGQKKKNSDIEQGTADVFAAIHLDLITEELGVVIKNMSTEQLEEAKKLAQEYIQYQ